jgi:hypothetical protein
MNNALPAAASWRRNEAIAPIFIGHGAPFKVIEARIARL